VTGLYPDEAVATVSERESFEAILDVYRNVLQHLARASGTSHFAGSTST
jgi:hypothetical protein